MPNRNDLIIGYPSSGQQASEQPDQPIQPSMYRPSWRWRRSAPLTVDDIAHELRGYAQDQEPASDHWVVVFDQYTPKLYKQNYGHDSKAKAIDASISSYIQSCNQCLITIGDARKRIGILKQFKEQLVDNNGDNNGNNE